MARLERPGGRNLHYEASGPALDGGPALVFHHGQPGAALLWDRLVEAVSAHGWRTVMLSRPGYGYSDRQPGRTVADAAADVEAVLDHLGVASFVAAGWSGGGPHALACGALLAPRCAAVATIAGVAPYAGVDDLDFTAGMGPENVAEFTSLIAGDPGLEGVVAALNADLSTLEAGRVIAALGGLVSAPDKEALTGPFAEYVADWMRLSAINGHYGYWDDDQAFISEWGFDLAQMEVPVRVWWADQDLMVPEAHGVWLASHVRGAVGVALSGEGHISLLSRHVDDIVAGLAGDAGDL